MAPTVEQCRSRKGDDFGGNNEVRTKSLHAEYILAVQHPPYSLGLSATSQQYFSLRTNQPAVLFSQNKSAPATSNQPNEQADHPDIVDLNQPF
jgi:hypothetical protein